MTCFSSCFSLPKDFVRVVARCCASKCSSIKKYKCNNNCSGYNSSSNNKSNFNSSRKGNSNCNKSKNPKNNNYRYVWLVNVV